MVLLGEVFYLRTTNVLFFCLGYYLFLEFQEDLVQPEILFLN